MSIRFACPCGQNLEAEPDHAGLDTVCPQCQRTLTIPARAAAGFSGIDTAAVPTAVRAKAPAVPVRPPLTNRYNDDGTLARGKKEADDASGDRPRRERHYDDDEAHADEDGSARPRMRRRDRGDEPTVINWTFVGGSTLVMLITGAWAALAIILGGNPVYPVLGFFAGLIGVVRGLLGRQRD